MLRGDGVTFVQNRHARIVPPRAQDGLERKSAAAKIRIQILCLEGMSALVGKLVSFVAYVKLCDIAFFGDLDTFLVGEFPEAPEQGSLAARPAVVKAIPASLLF